MNIRKHAVQIVLSIGLAASLSYGQTAVGSIVGTVADRQTNEPLVGVNVAVLRTTRGAATDLEGKGCLVSRPRLWSAAPAGTYQEAANP